jgi:hypothetical protein
MTLHDDRPAPLTASERKELTRLRGLQSDPRYSDPYRRDVEFVRTVDEAYERVFGD